MIGCTYRDYISLHMSRRNISGITIGVIKGESRSLDNGSY